MSYHLYLHADEYLKLEDQRHDLICLLNKIDSRIKCLLNAAEGRLHAQQMSTLKRWCKYCNAETLGQMQCQQCGAPK